MMARSVLRLIVTRNECHSLSPKQGVVAVADLGNCHFRVVDSLASHECDWGSSRYGGCFAV